MNINKIFTSHMVFAARKPIRVFGEGMGAVKVTFADKEISYVSYDKNWLVEFPPMEYGGPYDMKIEFENATTVLKDVYVGEVYLFSGQSNMDFSMKYQKGFSPENHLSNSSLRFFTLKSPNWSSCFSCEDGWMKCEAEQILNRSALAYFVGNEISQKCNIAVGIVVCAFGASVIESWVPEGTFKNIGIELSDDQKFADHTMEEYSRWNKDGYLYDTELSGIMPFSFSSVVWYQGESDASYDEAKVYCDELCELIRVWRRGFSDNKLPFAIIQIADFIGRDRVAWALIQKAQLEAQTKMTDVKTIISRDVCEDDEIHPPSKDKLAERITAHLLTLTDKI